MHGGDGRTRTSWGQAGPIAGSLHQKSRRLLGFLSVAPQSHCQSRPLSTPGIKFLWQPRDSRVAGNVASIEGAKL